MRVFTFIMVVQLATLAHAQEKPEYLLKKEQTNKREPGAPCKCGASTCAETQTTMAIQAAARQRVPAQPEPRGRRPDRRHHA
jgi:hypothetical protein